MNSHDTDTPILRLDGISLRRDGRDILSNICLEVQKGEFVAITGPNGGGKTTLLRIILGLQKPSAGRIERRHDSVSGYMPQKTTVDSHFPVTVEEVVESALLACSMTRNDKNRRLEETLAMLGLQDLRRRPIGHLSGGQLQRTLIARALVRKPDILLLDEPMSYLDRHAERELAEILGRLKDEGTTILMVTHSPAAVASITDRRIYIDRTSEPTAGDF
jgi:zinc transport system ATP-binding protein